MQLTYWNDYFPVSKYFRKAFEAIGLEEIATISSGKLLGGFAQWPATVDPTAMVRSSSESSFLNQAIKTTGLQVYPDTLAKQVLFDGAKKAVGVRVETKGYGYTLNATKEVVVAAGAVGFSTVSSI